MRRTPLRRTTPLRPGEPPQRRTSLRRAAWARSADRRPAMAASEAQRAKIVGFWCIVCQQTKSITPAHLTPRSLGGCDDPDCVVPLCWLHHRAYDLGELELLPYLEPMWRAEGGARRAAPGADRGGAAAGARTALTAGVSTAATTTASRHAPLPPSAASTCGAVAR